MLAYGGCQNDPNPVIGCEPEPGLEPQVAGTSKVAYVEFRGASGIGAAVLADGTLVSFDFASGEIVFRFPGGHEHRIHRDSLSPEARSQFIELARRSATNPEFSFEAGTGPVPGSGGPFVPLWGYPLHDSMFRFSNYHLHQKRSRRESPCVDPGHCRPPLMFQTIYVTAAPPAPAPSGLFDHFLWIRTLQPSLGGVQDNIPQWYLDLNRESWERWRNGRCEASTTNYIGALAAAPVAAKACAGVAIPAAGLVMCASALVTFVLYYKSHLQARVDCTSSYPGVGRWP